MPNVIGIFEDSSQAKQAIERMTKNRIGPEQIGMIALDADQDKLAKAGSAGTGAGIDAASGRLHGTLVGLGVPKDESASYEEQVRAGNVLVTVRAGNSAEADRIANLLEVEGAVEVEGAGTRGNVEAAPGYEGARADEEDKSVKSASVSQPSRKQARAGARIRIYGAD